MFLLIGAAAWVLLLALAVGVARAAAIGDQSL